MRYTLDDQIRGLEAAIQATKNWPEDVNCAKTWVAEGGFPGPAIAACYSVSSISKPMPEVKVPYADLHLWLDSDEAERAMAAYSWLNDIYDGYAEAITTGQKQEVIDCFEEKLSELRAGRRHF